MKDCFNTIVGNKALCRRIADDILSSKPPHAIILEGPHGTGKHTIARQTAAALVCERSADSSAPLPCLSCLSCRKVLENKSPDVTVIGCDGKASIGVDAVRFVREDINLIPNDSDYKVYIIEDADKMTSQAQNALLLTLEEPPAYAHFFLLCENSGLLLETIRSRAPTLRTELLSKDDIDKYISTTDRRAAQMKLSDPKGYGELLMASGYGIGQALEYLDPKTFAPISQIRALASDFVSTSIRSRGASEAIPLLARFSTKRDLLAEQLEAILEAIRDLIIMKKSDTAVLCFFADRDLAIELSDRVSMAFLFGLFQSVSEAKNEINQNANVKLCLMKLASKVGLV